LARRGSRRLAEDVRSAGTKPPHQGPKAPRDEDRWVLEETVRHEARGAVARGTSAKSTPPRRRPQGGRSPESRIGTDLAPAVGGDRAPKLEARLKDASRAFERGRFTEARRMLKPLADQAPGSATVHELLGLTHYRLGQWNAAVKELETFRNLTQSTEQHPVLADSYRALKRWPMVDELWEELRHASPSAELVAEGRIVTAGSLADRGRLTEAIRTLEPAVKMSKRPKPHHLRMAYALADLRERSGDIPGARDLFEWVARHDPDLADAAERADTLA
jgi:tetratricopeptide (TPR) repeat protein